MSDTNMGSRDVTNTWNIGNSWQKNLTTRFLIFKDR